MGSQPDPALGARIKGVRELPGVGAGSGLLQVGGQLVAIQDDAPVAAVIDPEAGEITLWPLTPDARRMAKKEKPDLEAIAGTPDGHLWLFGSGSAERRRQVCRLTPEGEATWFDVGALYDLIAARIGEAPNIEGAAATPAGFRLFHRGAGRSTCRNWAIDVARGPEGPCAPLREAFELDLGACGEVPLSVTDAAALPDGRFLLLAAAEDTPDAIQDGPVVGAAVAILDGRTVRWAPLTEPDGSASVRKCEGIAPDPDMGGAWLITDPDDVGRPAELVRVALTGPWGAF